MSTKHNTLSPFNQHKLNAEVCDGYYNTLYEEGPARTEKWARIQKFGEGTFRKVWLEKKEGSNGLRAVKRIIKGGEKITLRELSAMKELSKVWCAHD